MDLQITVTAADVASPEDRAQAIAILTQFRNRNPPSAVEFTSYPSDPDLDAASDAEIATALGAVLRFRTLRQWAQGVRAAQPNSIASISRQLNLLDSQARTELVTALSTVKSASDARRAAAGGGKAPVGP